MGIFDRMGRVISANFNALLDKAEDPRRSIDLTLDEMGAQIKAARQEVVRGVAAEKQLRRKVEDLEAEIAKWSNRAELAVKSGDDALAREALVHKQRVIGERERAEALRVEQRAQAMEMKAELERMEAKHGELSVKKGQLAAQVAQARAPAAGPADPPRAGGPAFVEFRRMEDQIEGVEAAFRAQREVDEALGGGRGPGGLTREEVEARFRALEHQGSASPATTSEVEEELARLKRRVRVDG